MEGESNEWQRRIDELRKQIAVLKAVAEADKETRRAEMSAMKSDLAETLARFEAEAAKERAESKAALARNEAATERLRTEMEKRSKWQTTFILAGIAVAVGILGWLQRGG